MTRILRRTVGALLAAVALAAGAAPARAGFTVYTNRTDFDAATTNQNSFDFSGEAAIDSFAFFNSPPGFTRNGVTFTSSTNHLFVIGRDFASPDFAFTGADFVLQDNESNSTMNIVLPPGTAAFAFDAGIQWALGPITVTVTLSSGDATSYTAPVRPELSFFGLVSDTQLTSISLSTPGFGLSLANFTSADAIDPVPAPPAVVLFGVGVVGLAGFRALRRKTQAVA
jgi:hypothetical protein